MKKEVIMGIALIVVGGLVLMTLISVVGSALGGKKKEHADKQTESRIAATEERLLSLEAKIMDRDERIAQLEHEVSFVNKLIEEKTNKR